MNPYQPNPLYQPYPVAQPVLVRALYHALRRSVITRMQWSACMRFAVMGAYRVEGA